MPAKKWEAKMRRLFNERGSSEGATEKYIIKKKNLGLNLTRVA